MYKIWFAEVQLICTSTTVNYNHHLVLNNSSQSNTSYCGDCSGGSDNAILLFSGYYNYIQISSVPSDFIEMDFFDKLKTSLSSPLRNLNLQQFTNSGNCDGSLANISTWSLDLPGFSEKNIRLLLYRDCDRRGKKCLYDSHHVVRDKNGKFSYIPAGPTSGSEMKHLSDYIFGCVALSSSNCGTQRFHKYNGKYVWSQVFNPKTIVPESEVSKSPCKLKLKLCSSASPEKVPLPQPPEGQDQVDGCISKNDRKANSAFSLPAVAMATSRSSTSVSNIGKCLSLPSKLVDCSQKTLLGLAIMIESTQENKDVLGPYLLSISKILEECSSWFSTIAAQAYRSPNTFVQTLYDFSTEFKTLLYKRLTLPLIVPANLLPSWKSIPALTSELLQLILQYDECNCKSGNRIKLVIVGGSRKVHEVTGLLYLLKLLLLKCKSSESDMDVGIDATTFYETVNNNSHQQQTKSPQSLPSFDSVILSSSTTSVSISSMASSISPPRRESVCQQILPKIQEPKIETEKLQRRDYDSGIELELEAQVPGSGLTNDKTTGSKASMKRSISQKFDSGCGSSSDEPDFSFTAPRRYSKGTLLHTHNTHSHEFEEVTFHLGDLGMDQEQSINTLALSEPNLDKLKVYHGTPGFMEAVDTNLKVEKLPVEPIHVTLNLDQQPTTSKIGPKSAYCQFCDSVAIVDKFSPLYYIQWIRSCWGLGEENFNAMKTFSTSKFIVVNLDKSYIRTINFEPNENTNTSTSTSTTHSPSNNFIKNISLGTSNSSNQSSCLINNLLHNLNTLSSEYKESEIENFLHVQIDFIRKIADDFGKSWSRTSNPDSTGCGSDEELVKKKYSYLSLSYKDLNLIYSLAKMKFPSLAHISFPET